MEIKRATWQVRIFFWINFKELKQKKKPRRYKDFLLQHINLMHYQL
ncbi:hypothetical protein BTURTLESOX_433 [bacterium endosymbiont of Bathymodiolus sp. 5 South]|nr:hypothetical protein BTURTLESOX_433 [bacterium endosymbiont of Bathymodiolus sp. 5 South]